MEQDTRIKQLPLVTLSIFDSSHHPVVGAVFAPLKSGQNCQPCAKLHGHGMFPCFVIWNVLRLTDSIYRHNHHPKRKKRILYLFNGMILTISLQCADWNPKGFKSSFGKRTYCSSVGKQSHFWFSIFISIKLFQHFSGQSEAAY